MFIFMSVIWDLWFDFYVNTVWLLMLNWWRSHLPERSQANLIANWYKMVESCQNCFHIPSLTLSPKVNHRLAKQTVMLLSYKTPLDRQAHANTWEHTHNFATYPDYNPTPMSVNSLQIDFISLQPSLSLRCIKPTHTRFCQFKGKRALSFTFPTNTLYFAGKQSHCRTGQAGLFQHASELRLNSVSSSLVSETWGGWGKISSIQVEIFSQQVCNLGLVVSLHDE